MFLFDNRPYLSRCQLNQLCQVFPLRGRQVALLFESPLEFIHLNEKREGEGEMKSSVLGRKGVGEWRATRAHPHLSLGEKNSTLSTRLMNWRKVWCSETLVAGKKATRRRGEAGCWSWWWRCSISRPSGMSTIWIEWVIVSSVGGSSRSGRSYIHDLSWTVLRRELSREERRVERGLVSGPERTSRT